MTINRIILSSNSFEIIQPFPSPLALSSLSSHYGPYLSVVGWDSISNHTLLLMSFHCMSLDWWSKEVEKKFHQALHSLSLCKLMTQEKGNKLQPVVPVLKPVVPFPPSLKRLTPICLSLVHSDPPTSCSVGMFAKIFFIIILILV